MRRILIVGALVAGVVVLSGCKKASESVAEKIMEGAIERDGDGKAEVDIRDDRMTIKTAEGTVEVGGAGKVPDTFPKDVFLIKDGNVTMTMKVPDGVQVVIETKHSVDKAAALYGTEMKALGWEEEQNSTMGNMAMIAYKKDAREATVVITAVNAGSQVQIVTTPSAGQ